MWPCPGSVGVNCESLIVSETAVAVHNACGYSCSRKHIEEEVRCDGIPKVEQLLRRYWTQEGVAPLNGTASVCGGEVPSISGGGCTNAWKSYEGSTKAARKLSRSRTTYGNSSRTDNIHEHGHVNIEWCTGLRHWKRRKWEQKLKEQQERHVHDIWVNVSLFLFIYLVQRSK